MDKKQEKICNQRKGMKLLLLVGITFSLGMNIISLGGKDDLQMGKAVTTEELEALWNEDYTLYLPGTLGRINVNTANQETLELLPGVGEKLAKRMIEYREAHGSFEKIDEIVNVSGIGLKKLEQMKEYIVAE